VAKDLVKNKNRVEDSLRQMLLGTLLLASSALGQVFDYAKNNFVNKSPGVPGHIVMLGVSGCVRFARKPLKLYFGSMGKIALT
jgi:hypothetical protein